MPRSKSPRRSGAARVWAIALLAGLAPRAAAPTEVITLRSGNGAIGGPDSALHAISGAAGTALRPLAFTPADFAAACAGPAATVVTPCVCWLTSLPSDPVAPWVALDTALTPGSMLYCSAFDITSPDICSASIDFAFACDDRIGDPAPGANVAGVYLNGNPLPAFSGGDYVNETRFSDPAIAGFLRPGANELHVYQRDFGFTISGIVYSATLTIEGAPAASAGPDGTICAGETWMLDGAGSSTSSCPGALEYRWSVAGTPIAPWSTIATLPVVPAATTTYDLEVRCPLAPGCVGSDTVTVAVYPLPLVQAGSDQMGCENDSFNLLGSGTAAQPCTTLEYRWRDGAIVVRDWSSSPAAAVTVAVDTAYTLDVRCAAAPSCAGLDSVLIDVYACPLAVVWGDIAATEQADATTVRWTTLSEVGTLGFEVLAREDGGPVATLPLRVEAAGAGTRYALRDERPPAATPRSYQVVELTASGRGDASAWIRSEREAGAGASAGRGRSRAPRAHLPRR